MQGKDVEVPSILEVPYHVQPYVRHGLVGWGSYYKTDRGFTLVFERGGERLVSEHPTLLSAADKAIELRDEPSDPLLPWRGPGRVFLVCNEGGTGKFSIIVCHENKADDTGLRYDTAKQAKDVVDGKVKS